MAMLPAGWEIASLDELYDFSNGINADKSAFGSGVPFINVLEIITRETLDDSLIPGRVTLPAATIKRYQVRHGDVLFNRTSETQDEVALSSVYLGDSEPVFGGFVFRAQAKTKRLLAEYAAYALRARYVREQVVARGQGGIRANVSQRDLNAVRLLLPSPNEQQSIAEALADASRHCSMLELAIVKKQAMKQGMMQQLLTGRTRLPGFSETWDSGRLGAVLGTIQAGVSVNSVSGLGVHGILKTSCVSAGIFDPSERKTISPADIAKARVYPRADSLIISRMNTPSLVGEVGYVGADEPALFLPDRLWLARGDKSGKVDMRWLGCLLSGDQYREHMREIATGTSDSMKNISRSALLGIQIPLPEIQEQRAISAAFAEVDREIDALRLRLAKARDVKQGMMQQLLTGRTRLAVQE